MQSGKELILGLTLRVVGLGVQRVAVQVLHRLDIAVVGGRRDAQCAGHDVVELHDLERLDHCAGHERRTIGNEGGVHVTFMRIEAMIGARARVGDAPLGDHPAQFGHEDQIRRPLGMVLMEPLRELLSPVDRQRRVRQGQGLVEGIDLVLLAMICGEHRIALPVTAQLRAVKRLETGEIDVVIQIHDAFVRQIGHAVIAHHHDVEFIENAVSAQSFQKKPDLGIYFRHCSALFGTVYPGVMACRVDRLEIDTDEAWPILFRQAEPFQYLRDPICIAHTAIERMPVTRTHAVEVHP